MAMKFEIMFITVMAIATVPLPMLLLGEHIAKKKPQSKFTRWWRKYMISDTHSEDDVI